MALDLFGAKGSLAYWFSSLEHAHVRNTLACPRSVEFGNELAMKTYYFFGHLWIAVHVHVPYAYRLRYYKIGLISNCFMGIYGR